MGVNAPALAEVPDAPVQRDSQARIASRIKGRVFHLILASMALAVPTRERITLALARLDIKERAARLTSALVTRTIRVNRGQSA